MTIVMFRLYPSASAPNPKPEPLNALSKYWPAPFVKAIEKLPPPSVRNTRALAIGEPVPTTVTFPLIVAVVGRSCALNSSELFAGTETPLYWYIEYPLLENHMLAVPFVTFIS